MEKNRAEYPSEDRMRSVFNLVAERVERRYGIPVSISDVTDPFTGDLDGAEIKVDYANDIENALFILVHLFGHTIQWNIDPNAREHGTKARAEPDENRIAALHAYEVEACRYSLQLLHECGVEDFDQWLADFAACDFAYLTHFYRTGEKKAFRSFWRPGSSQLEPLAVPDFTPKKWTGRWSGVVV
jgi:hypothetical protein